MKSSYHLSMYEKGDISVFDIGNILLYILKIQLSSNRGLTRVFFHLIHKAMPVSEKKKYYVCYIKKFPSLLCKHYQ